MPPFQDSALRLSDARKTELEVFFYFFIFYLFILFIFNNGLGFTGTQGSCLSEIWASFVLMLHITNLSSKMSSHGLNHMTHAQIFFFFLVEHSGLMGLITHKRHSLQTASPP